jgi:CheY-like chemotaxis protein
MQFPIDVVFLDQDLHVLRIAASVRPFRAVSCRGSREVVELRAGECERRGLVVGDRVAWASTTAATSVGSELPVPPFAQTPPSHGLVASADARFVKLARFLLEGKGIGLVESVQPNALLGALDSSDPPSLIVLDVHEEAAAGLATANAARALSPGLPIFLVGAPDVAARAAAGVRIYDKWNEAEELMLAITTALDNEAAQETSRPL